MIYAEVSGTLVSSTSQSFGGNGGGLTKSTLEPTSRARAFSGRFPLGRASTFGAVSSTLMPESDVITASGIRAGVLDGRFCISTGALPLPNSTTVVSRSTDACARSLSLGIAAL